MKKTYKTLEDIGIRIGFSAFTLPKGSSVTVEQVDKEHRKVLLRV
jgi:hypothetical protein